MKKCKWWSVCCTVTAVFLIVTCAFTPLAMEGVIKFAAKKGSQLTPENEKDWKGIPGTHDIGIYWRQYFYNCTNAEDVIYNNHKPEFKEFGPYTYREYDNYTDLVYEDLENVIDGEELPAVFSKFIQYTEFDSDTTGTIDTPLYLTN